MADNFVYSVSTEVPGAVAMYKHELIFSPRMIVELKIHKLKQYNVFSNGGKKWFSFDLFFLLTLKLSGNLKILWTN